jgi:uncharacterized repeat protein (TIGR03803 family)
MKTKNLFILPALIAVLNLIPAGRVTAQTFTTLHSFTATNGLAQTNSDGANPYAGLITNSSGNTLYGTAWAGGQFGKGTVFAVNTDGTGFTSVHGFTGGSDGAFPHAGLILSGNTLFGTAAGGGGFGVGTVFFVNTSGTGFTILRTFQPFLLSTFSCTSGYDCRDAISPCAECHYFPWGWRCVLRAGYCPGDTHGGYPYAELILSGDTLYGTAKGGGVLDVDPGTVFAVNINGTNFRQLYGFGSLASGPKAGVILSGDTLYGTTFGTVFAVNTMSGNLSVVHSFTGSDGSDLQAGLVLSGNTLYGTASQGGSFSYGTVFAVNTNGSGFTTLHSFTACATNSSGVETNGDGAGPQAGLILSGNTLYGTASAGGTSGNGTVFSLSFRPQLTITPSGTNVVLSWPTHVAGFDYTGYTLQAAPALTDTFTNLPAATSPYTNPIAGPQQFFRLSQ